MVEENLKTVYKNKNQWDAVEKAGSYLMGIKKNYMNQGEVEEYWNIGNLLIRYSKEVAKFIRLKDKNEGRRKTEDAIQPGIPENEEKV